MLLSLDTRILKVFMQCYCEGVHETEKEVFKGSSKFRAEIPIVRDFALGLGKLKYMQT